MPALACQAARAGFHCDRPRVWARQLRRATRHLAVCSTAGVLKLRATNERKSWQLPTMDTKSARKNWPKSARKKTSSKTKASAKAPVKKTLAPQSTAIPPPTLPRRAAPQALRRQTKRLSSWRYSCARDRATCCIFASVRSSGDSTAAAPNCVKLRCIDCR